MSSGNFPITKRWDGSSADGDPKYYVDISLSASTGDMVIHVDAPFYNDAQPPVAPCRYDELSDFEVVEIFISGMPNTVSRHFSPYIEIEVGPHGHYFLLFFLNEADWETSDDSIELDQPPVTRIDREAGRWTAEIAIPSYLLPEPTCEDDMSCNWMCNTFAIHGDSMSQDSKREFLAHAAVEGCEPNFHQLSSFVPLKLFETIEIRGKVDRTASIAKDLLKTSQGGPKDTTKKPGFTFSTHSPEDTTARLLEDIAENVYEDMLEDMAEGAGASTSGDGGVFEFARKGTNDSDTTTQRVPPPLTVAQVCANLREDQIKSHSPSADLELGEQFLRHIQPDEFVVLHGMLWKRKGLSFKKRMMILTSKPRLLYCNYKGTYKGSIPWSLTKLLDAKKISEKKFDLEMQDKSRVYHLTDNDGGADRWIDCVNRIVEAQKAYLKRRGSIL